MTVLLITGCSSNCNEKQTFSLQGAWMLQQVCTPEGYIYNYMPNDQTRLRIYQGDSAMFECKLIETEQALVVEPQEKSSVTFFNKGGGEYLYMEGDELRPIKVVNDSVITIQRIGRIFTWQRANSIGEEWGDEIRTIIDYHMEYERPFDAPHSYVLSSKEKEQENVIHLLEYATIAFIVILVLIGHIAQINRKAKKRLQQQLQQIQEIHEELPQPVKQAIENVESTYFSSDEYYTLQHRITSGQRLKDEEWQEIEAQLKKVYPGFSSQLRNLHIMSELEYQTCLLIKLRIAPTDIATILSRDTSTISTVRSRLYRKVFDKKGGAREWDKFIMSIGA